MKPVKKDTAFIATVYNESGSITDFLDSLTGQELLPGQIIIVDGGSKDGTYQMLQDYFSHYQQTEVILMQKPAGISEGRNTAIAAARAPIICVSDAGCILNPNWLKNLTEEAGPDLVVGGYSAAWADSFLERCLAAAVVVLPEQVKEEKFMPSSRNVCFYRSAWEKVGGYPQYMDYGEDMKFNFNLIKAGYHIKFVPQAVVQWKMRASLPSIFRQFFRYAKGDAIGRMYKMRHMIRIISLFLFIAVLALAFSLSGWILLMLAPLLAFYAWPAWRRIGAVFEGRSVIEKAAASIFMLFLLPYIDLAKLAGYIYGWCSPKQL